ncbi:MAG TPA: DUF2934 domain-containing protein [Pseudomonas sp.]|jgi:hypothetical protein|nr:DUF2934 domain-containing protein [Pseudomonas sp.]
MSDEQRIRELAYQIWEAEGCPDGEQDRHWGLASRLASETVQTGTPTPPARVSRSRPHAAAAADTPATTSRRGGGGRQRNEQPH